MHDPIAMREGITHEAIAMHEGIMPMPIITHEATMPMPIAMREGIMHEAIIRAHTMPECMAHTADMPRTGSMSAGGFGACAPIATIRSKKWRACTAYLVAKTQ